MQIAESHRPRSSLILAPMSPHTHPLMSMCTLSIHDERTGKTSFLPKSPKVLPQSLDVLLGQQQWTQLDDDASVATVSGKWGTGCAGDRDWDTGRTLTTPQLNAPDGADIRTELNRTELNRTEPNQDEMS